MHFFAARRQAVEWKTYGHDRPELVERLSEACFEPEELETVMVAEADRVVVVPGTEFAGLWGGAVLSPWLEGSLSGPGRRS